MKFELKNYKQCLLTFALIPISAQVCFAQIEFTEHTISNDFDGAVSVYAVDMDGDDDIDILGAAYEADDITWWENDGEQNFTEHTIANNFDGSTSVYATDLDSDGDIDVIGAAWYAWDIVWWENDGEQDFTEHIISGNFPYPTCIYAADIDNDGDMDVLGASREADDITWWENNGEQDFTEHTIAGDFDGARSVYAADIDSDGDIDVLGAASWDDDITWWENDGQQDFTEHTIAGDFDGADCVYTSDIDNDGDMDVLGSAQYACDIIWWENERDHDFTEHIIADDFYHSRFVFTVDIDRDGDIDVLGAAILGDDITWWESDLDPMGWLVLPDSGFAEDSTLHLSLDYFYDYIRSPNFPDSSLVITFEDGEHAFGEIGDEDLTISADQDWFGIDSLMLIVTDTEENSDTTYQRIIVTPVNDLPSAFGLLEPADSAEIADYPVVTFSWEESIDEADDDTVTYALILTYNGEDHCYANIGITMAEISREDLSIDPNMETSVEWAVWAHDGTDSTQCNESFNLTVASLSVRESGYSLPTELKLESIYPNPFNAVTTIKYALPTQSHVKLVVYNLLGQQVASLVDGYKKAGFYNTVLNAANLTSGLYIVHLDAGEFSQSRKLVLAR